MRRLLSSCLALCLGLSLAPAAATAAPVTVMVHGADGRPLVGAVVLLDVPGIRAPTPRGPYQVEQRGIQFAPQLLIVPVGASVAFPNRDKVRHHVYSFSKAKRFELKLYGRDDTRAVVFDRPGPVSLGCNIHDQMNGLIFVSATPFAAATDATGRVTFDAPAARATLRVWHPTVRAPGNEVAQSVTIARQGLSASVTAR
jgi:plastocyanin